MPDLPAVRSMIGDGARVLIERAVSHVAAADLDDLLRRFTLRYAEVPCRHSRPYPGAVDVLGDLRAAGAGSACARTSPRWRRSACSRPSGWGPRSMR